MILAELRPGATTRESRASRRRACVPWRGGARSPRVRSWSSCENEIRASLSGDDGWVGMCASALRNCAPHWLKVSWGKPKVYRLGRRRRRRCLRHFPASVAGIFVASGGPLLVHIALRFAICTTRATINFFSASNIHEINHSQCLSPRAAQSSACAVEISC